MGQLLAAFEPLSIRSLTTLWQFAPVKDCDDDETVFAIVRHLGSVLSNVASSDSSAPIVFLHTSFRDFLTDKDRSGDGFCVDLRSAHRELAHACLGLMLEKLKFNICNLETSYLANEDVPNLASRITENIPASLSYACQLWDDHLERIPFDPGVYTKLESFFNDKFLFWLEVLSLTRVVALASPALASLKTWLSSSQQNVRLSVS
jgi:hypothetical protein